MNTQVLRRWTVTAPRQATQPVIVGQRAYPSRAGFAGQAGQGVQATGDLGLLFAGQAVLHLSSPCVLDSGGQNSTVAAFQTAWNSTTDSTMGQPQLKVDGQYGEKTAGALSQAMGPSVNVPGPCSSGVPGLITLPTTIVPGSVPSAPWPWWKTGLAVLFGAAAVLLGYRWYANRYAGGGAHSFTTSSGRSRYAGPRFRSGARATRMVPEFERYHPYTAREMKRSGGMGAPGALGAAHSHPGHPFDAHKLAVPAAVAGVGVLGYLGYRAWKNTPTSNKILPPGAPPGSAAVPYSQMPPAAQALYQQGLWNWIQREPGAWPATVESPQALGITGPGSFADEGNLMLATDAFQTAKGIPQTTRVVGGVDSFINSQTYAAVVAYAQ
jgi:hypothetical protein